jgi:membrane-bound lytic murein transglycosylase A
MIAQDTGAAIVGPARADLYFGAGDKAGQVAASGITAASPFYCRVNSIRWLVAAAHIPLPPVKPWPSQVAASTLPPFGPEERARVASIGHKQEKLRRAHVSPVSYASAGRFAQPGPAN